MKKREDAQAISDAVRRMEEELASHEARALELRNALNLIREYVPEDIPNLVATPIPDRKYAQRKLSIRDAMLGLLAELGGSHTAPKLARELLKRGFEYPKGRTALTRSVGSQLRYALSRGEVSRVSEGQYGITDKGRQAIR